MFLFGLGSAIAGTFWFWNIFGVISLALWGYIALTISLFGLAATLIARHKLRPWINTAALGAAWTAVDFARGELLPLSFPWLQLSIQAQVFWPLLSCIGSYGLSGLLIVGMLAILRTKWSLGLAIPLLVVVAALTQPVIHKGPGIPVLCVQTERHSADHLREISQQGTSALVIWPELAAPTLNQAFVTDDRVLVTGTSISSGSSWENTAVVTQNGKELGRHVKNHTVHFFNDGKRGTTQLPIPTPLGKIGTPICFDCDHEDVVRKMTSAGAEFFAVPSIDPSHWGPIQHRMHGELFRLRAAENQRYIAVASGSGRTQIIAPNARIAKQLPLMTEGSLTGSVHPRQELSFYTRYGWLFPWVCLGYGWLFPWVCLVFTCAAMLTALRKPPVSTHGRQVKG
jgi:apolipoprotein N-acyltransferase